MADDDRTLFAPTPVPVTFMIRGVRVETELYLWQDLPVKDALAVHALGDEMREAAPTWTETLPYLQRIVRVFCPSLDQHALEELSTRQLQSAIATAYGGAVDPRPAVEAGAASPSPSAASTTLSPASTAGDPTSSGA